MTEKKATSAKETPTDKKPVIERSYTGKKEIDSDTFKLEVAAYKRNISFDPARPQYEHIEHCHFYHTYDSNGRQCTTCNAVGGHQHTVTVEYDENGQMLSADCGPSVGRAGDNHIHTIRYIKSDRVERRIINENAQKYILNAQKYN